MEEDSATRVLGNLDLLADILTCVGSPIWLVRAALVSKTWLRVASNRDFLRRFRKLTPPRVLGISIDGDIRVPDSSRLLPVPHPPELAAAARFAARTFGKIEVEALPLYAGQCVDYSNGRLLVKLIDRTSVYVLSRVYNATYAVGSLLHHDQMITLPQSPRNYSDNHSREDLRFSSSSRFQKCFLMENDGEDASMISCLHLKVHNYFNWVICAHFSVLRSGIWGGTPVCGDGDSTMYYGRSGRRQPHHGFRRNVVHDFNNRSQTQPPICTRLGRSHILILGAPRWLCRCIPGVSHLFTPKSIWWWPLSDSCIRVPASCLAFRPCGAVVAQGYRFCA